MLDVICDDFKFSDYKLCLTERPAIPVAEQEVLFHDGIDEKDGSLTEYGPLKDRQIQMTVNYLETIPSKLAMREFRGKLLNKHTFKLFFNDEKDIYYLVKSIKMGAIENEIAEKGEFKLDLVLDPFDYKANPKVKTGTNSLTVDNQGTYKALPIITLTGTGNITLKCTGGYSVSIDSLNGTVVIDCEKLDYYDPKFPDGRLIKLHTKKFPELKVGTNTISTTGNVTILKVEFKERFR